MFVYRLSEEKGSTVISESFRAFFVQEFLFALFQIACSKHVPRLYSNISLGLITVCAPITLTPAVSLVSLYRIIRHWRLEI